MNGPLLSAADDFDDHEPLSEQWRFREHRDGDVATYAMGSVSARVEDQDGDRAVWDVWRDGEVIRSGSDPDFWDAIAAVEDVLIEIGWLWREPARDVSDLVEPKVEPSSSPAMADVR